MIPNGNLYQSSKHNTCKVDSFKMYSAKSIYSNIPNKIVVHGFALNHAQAEAETSCSCGYTTILPTKPIPSSQRQRCKAQSRGCVSTLLHSVHSTHPKLEVAVLYNLPPSCTTFSGPPLSSSDSVASSNGSQCVPFQT